MNEWPRTFTLSKARNGTLSSPAGLALLKMAGWRARALAIRARRQTDPIRLTLARGVDAGWLPPSLSLQKREHGRPMIRPGACMVLRWLCGRWAVGRGLPASLPACGGWLAPRVRCQGHGLHCMLRRACGWACLPEGGGHSAGWAAVQWRPSKGRRCPGRPGQARPGQPQPRLSSGDLASLSLSLCPCPAACCSMRRPPRPSYTLPTTQTALLPC